MLRALTFAVALLFSGHAMAQQLSANEEALSERLFAEIQANLQARSEMIAAKRQVALLNIRIKELEAAAAPKGAQPTKDDQPPK